MRSLQHFFKKRALRTFSTSSSSWQNFLIAIGAQVILFLFSARIENELEVLFALLYLAMAVGAAIFLGRGPAIVAAILASLSVDYHYLHPNGKILGSLDSFVFLIVSMGIVQFSISAVGVLQALAHESEEVKKALSKAVSAKEELLAVVAHDLRQPLASFILKNQIALRYLEKQNIKAALKALNNSGQSLQQINCLIDDLLDSAKVDSGTLLLNQEYLDLRPFLVNLFETFEDQAEKKQITLKLDFPSEAVLSVFIDSHRISRVLANLIGNALKFAPIRGRISLSVKRSDECLELKVHNTGEGIPRELVGNLFQRNWQAKKTAHQGSGLGLYICKGIVNAHDGKIWYDAAAEGATFCFTIPLLSSNSGVERISKF